MGTRGAFGVIIGEKEKIGYNQFDSYPEGKGVENLRWLRESLAEGELENLRELAEKARLVDDDVKPTPEDVESLRRFTDLGVSQQSTNDWYCLTREAHGDLGDMLQSGYIYDNSNFPLDSLFCEWAYIVDFDRSMFEVYAGFQKKLPKKGRWKGRPTKAEDEKAYEVHVAYAKKQRREPWHPLRSEYKAVELVAEWPFHSLPSDEEFLNFFALLAARKTLELVKKYPEDTARLVNRIVEEGLAETGKPSADEWAMIEDEARTLLAKHSSPGQVALLATREASQD